MTDYNLRLFGTHHPACGRVLPTHKRASLDDPNYLKAHPGIEPVRHVIEGARAYAHHLGIADPHDGSIDYHRVMTDAPTLREIGRAYDALPEHDPRAERHFAAMRDEVLRQHHFMTHNMGIRTEVTDRDPYKDIHELARDVRDNKRIKVLGTHVTGSHPYFSDEDNDKFRAVHDVFGHLATGRSFDAHGEEGTYQAHARMFTHRARPALVSETRGQNASLHLNGAFGPQRIAILPKQLWHPGLARESLRWDQVEEFRLIRHLQDRRAEEATGGYRSEMNSYFGRDGNKPTETPFTFKDYLKHTAPAKERESFESERDAYHLGHQWGGRHLKGESPNEDFEWDSVKHSKPDHFWQGYTDGVHERPMMQTYAVLVSGMDDAPQGLRVVAHVSGNNIDVLHCPFCGSGAVIARSDGTIECGYCTSVFTVQVQPAYAGFPQSIDGQPYQWPGMPDPNAVMAPDMPAGTNVNPNAAGGPMDGAPVGDPLGDGGLLGVGGGAPESSDPDAAGDDDDDSDDNPFAKGGDDSSSDSKSDKKSKDKKSGDNPFAKKKSSSLKFRTANGAELDAAEFEAHLAIRYAKNPLLVAQHVREARANGGL